MRRSPNACRRAAHSLQPTASQHIWIPDDALTVACNRFFRISCPQQKRHGSQTPGPLEARRRATKRGMSISANVYPQGGFTPPFSFGALFGFGSPPPQPAWRYEPPSSHKEIEPLDLPAKHAESSCPSPPKTSFENNLSSFHFASLDAGAPSNSKNIPPFVLQGNDYVFQDVVEAEEPSSTISDRQDVDDESLNTLYSVRSLQACCAQFAERIAGAEKLADQDRLTLLYDTIRYCSPKNELDGTFSLYVLEHLIEEQWHPALIVGSLSRNHISLPSIYTPEGLEFLYRLDAISEKFADRIPQMGQMYMKMAESARNSPISSVAHDDVSLFLLIRGLWDSTRLRGTHIETSVAELLYQIAGKISEPEVRKQLLLSLSEPTKAAKRTMALIIDCTTNAELRLISDKVLNCVPRSLLRSWIPSITVDLLKGSRSGLHHAQSTRCLDYMHTWFHMLYTLDSKANTIARAVCLSDVAFKQLATYFFSNRFAQLSPPVLITALQQKLVHHNSFHGLSTGHTEDVISSSLRNFANRKYAMGLNKTIASLMTELKAASLPYQGFADLLLPVIYEHKGLQSCLDLLEQLAERELALCNTTYLDDIVSKRLSNVSDVRNIWADKDHQRIASTLHLCRRMKKILAKLRSLNVAESYEKLDSVEANRKFRYILDRAADARMLPIAYRDMDADISMEQRSEMIHQLADQYSNDHTRTYLQNWRSVQYLYKYLRTYKLPVNPLFTQAMVRVCLTRPLSEKRFVCARRINWVCQLVTEVEGESVAKKLEYDVWVLRGNLIARAKKALADSGARGPAHVNTMKRLDMI